MDNQPDSSVRKGNRAWWQQDRLKLKHALIALTGLALFGLAVIALAAYFLFNSLFFGGSDSRVLEKPFISPSGLLEAKAEIPGAEAGPGRQHCVKLKVTNLQTKKETELQTGASDYQRWAIGWAPGDILILYSSDIGTYAYEIRNNDLVERPITEEEAEIGRDAYQRKYGKRPRF